MEVSLTTNHEPRLFDPRAAYSNKILTSAKNGEIITWDMNKNNNTKLGMHCTLYISEISHLRP